MGIQLAGPPVAIGDCGILTGSAGLVWLGLFQRGEHVGTDPLVTVVRTVSVLFILLDDTERH